MLTQTGVIGLLKAAFPLLQNGTGLTLAYMMLKNLREDADEKDWGEPAETIIMGYHLVWFGWLILAVHRHLPPILQFWFNSLPLK